MEQPYVAASQSLAELTPKAIILAIILAVILAASNVYIGLKVGLIVSTSIPAAVVAMVLFRFAKESNILENNIVQAGASASGSVAAGIVFVIPALLIIHYWPDINFGESIFICLVGGVLGVLFSIPLRRALLSQEDLRFPEGRAIAEVLKINESSQSLKDLFIGSIIAVVIQSSQQGLKIMASAYHLWFKTGNTLAGFSLGFDITMLGAGYIIGFNVGLSIILGAILGWLIGVPILAHDAGIPINANDITDYVMSLWSHKLRYIGIGAMLVSGIWSLIICAKPIVDSLIIPLKASKSGILNYDRQSRTEYDIPINYILAAIFLLLLALGIYLMHEITVLNLGLSTTSASFYFIFTLAYIMIAGFIFSAITAYFSGLVGVSASPVSAVNIAILITVSLLLNGLIQIGNINHQPPTVILHSMAISIIIATIIASAASMSNGTIQDLKTGAILGATPWKLQIILIIGVVVSTLIVPPVIDLLFHVYGIGGVFPRPNMDPGQVLGAPQATLIAAIAQGVFFHNLPFDLIYVGAGISIILIILNYLLKPTGKKISLVAFAIGIYLPMAVTVPIFFGSLVSLFVYLKQKRIQANSKTTKNLIEKGKHSTTLIACGLVAGGSITGLLLSIPFAIERNTNVLSIVPKSFAPIATGISIAVTIGVCYWMYRTAIRNTHQ